MDDVIKKLSEGQLSDDEVKVLENKLSDEGKKLLKEALAFTTKRQDEATKAEQFANKVKELQTQIQSEEEKLGKMKNEGTQFRQEQVDKARDKFFTEYKIPAEKQNEYLEKFKALDSGKVDSDLIYQDFVGVYAFLNKDTLLDAEKQRIESQRIADEEAARGAGNGGGSGGGGDESPKFSESTQKLAKDAGIPVEAADKIAKEGMTRTLG